MPSTHNASVIENLGIQSFPQLSQQAKTEKKDQNAVFPASSQDYVQGQ